MLAIHAILHPTDFSEYSDAAFQLACSLARKHGAKLILLHVGELRFVGTGIGMAPPPLPQEYDRPALEAKLRAFRVADPGIVVERRVVYGTAGLQILDTAKETACGLIVMGTHGRGGLRRAVMGSVAEQVMRKAPCPVLTVKADGSVAIRRILHPTDFSKQAGFAFDFACSLAREHGAMLTVLHVVVPPIAAYGEAAMALPIEPIKETATQKLTQIRPSDPNVCFEHQLEEGDAAERIVHAAKVNQCDLIVMGMHGWTGLGRLIIGSVAEQVVRKATCAVVTLRMPFSEGGSATDPSPKAAQAAV
jgi:nucleotide-binding universal stress UspA family protein